MTDLWPALITTIGTLVGSFGGFSLAARAQRRQAERDDARSRRDADAARSIKLEDERHDFQLTTLLTLQELVRRNARAAFLWIEKDRAAIEVAGGYRQVPPEEPDEFEKAVEFIHQIARVTDSELRHMLESFNSMCGEYSVPPPDWRQLSKTEALAVQEQRATRLTELATKATSLLGEHLRREIDRAG